MKLRSLIDRPYAALSRSLASPWFVSPEWLRQVRAAYDESDHPKLASLVFGWGSAVRATGVDQGVGIVTIRGPLLQGSFTDYTDIGEAVEAHAEDPAVHSILLDIDSPGGDAVPELFQLALKIRAARARKPITALANSQATSAAYVIACSASQVYASGRGAILGSLGAIILHREQSGWLKKQGLGVSEIVSGKHKADLSPNKPLNSDGHATLQSIVNVAFDELVEAVAAGRGIDESAIRAQEAAVYLGEAAIAVKLADGIKTREEIVGTLSARAGSHRAGAQMLATAQAAGDPTSSSAATKNLNDPSSDAATAKTPEQERLEAIRDLCELNGCPEQAGAFMANPKMSEARVRNIMLLRLQGQASDDLVLDNHPPQPGEHATREPTSAQIDAIYERWNADERGSHPRHS